MRKLIVSVLAFMFGALPAIAATTIPFTINVSKPVNVTTTGGTPRIALDVGGVTRYASYASGTGTSSLTFTYPTVAGDVDLDGITVSSPIQLNGGAIADLAGNPMTNLTFTPPNTTTVKVNYPSLGMDFTNGANGRYTLNGTPYTTLASFLTATGGSFTRASVGTYYDSAGTLQTASANTPRFDYDPVTHAPKGILIEEGRTNQWATSDKQLTADGAGAANFTNVVDTDPTGASITMKRWNGASATDYGSSCVDYGNRTTTSYSPNPALWNANYEAISFYVKKVSGNGRIAVHQYHHLYGACVTIDLTAQTVTPNNVNITAAIEALPNNWYRIKLGSKTSPACFLSTCNDNQWRWYAKTGEQFYAWGMQFEQGAFPTSYIPTTTAAVTRAADVLTVPTAGWYNGTSGTQFVSQTYTVNAGDFSPVIGNGDGLIGISYTGTSGNNITAFIDGVNTVTSGALAASGLNKVALGNSTASATISRNGSAVATGSGKALSAATILYFGRDFNGTTCPAPKHIEKYKFYPIQVPNTQLQLMTQ